MKATKDFTIILREGIRVPYKEGDDKTNLKFIKIKKNQEIPNEHIRNIIERNLELVDVEYKDKKPILPKEFSPEPKPIKKMKIEKRKYSQESLTKLYNEEGMSALKEVGKEFDPLVTDRSYRRLIAEILRAQEERQRKG